MPNMSTNNEFDPSCVRAYADAYGLPTNYVSVDVETTGLSLEHDLVIQLGWCSVKENVSVINSSVIINHITNRSSLEVDAIKKRLESTKLMMEKKATDGYTFPWTTQLLVEKGKEPKVAADKFVNACQSFDYILGHYGTKFDFPVINKFIHSQCGMKLPDVSSGQLVDTAIIVKAAKVGCIPKLGESYLSFMQRVDSARKNVKFSMASCIELFNLKEMGAVRKRAHDAAYDAWLSHLILERLRAIAQ